jgi:lipopolysaccharide transport system ATP-binding protein
MAAVEVKGLCKRFRIPIEKRRTIYEHLLGMLQWGRHGYETFEALSGVSFSLRKGETLGVIGPNGSGKSTLLKLLAGVLYPDSGSIRIDGRIAPFLELGVGFQPELTARDNVYLYASIMGLSKRDVDRRYEDILEFAELKRFQDMRLRNFSSGMYVRLAFSIAIETDPDILLLDEVFAVGDERFQKKCASRIEEFRRSGKTIVFVSHDMASVKKLCAKSILLSGGKVALAGDTSGVIDAYERIAREPVTKKAPCISQSPDHASAI